MILVCAQCAITPPCRCGGAERTPSLLERWYNPSTWDDPPIGGEPAPTVTAFDGVDETLPALEEIDAIVGHLPGRGDGPPWIALLRLRDGRWCYLSYTVLITGDCYFTVAVAATRERLWWQACTDEDRDRFTRQLTPEALEAELVAIDELLESTDPELRALGERRMRQRRG